MDSDLKPAGNADLSPRAGIAMLTLQIRATTHEAAVVESQYTPIDHDAARQQLRERLAPLVEERERGFAVELEAARAEAEMTVTAARRSAASIIAEREVRVEAERMEAERLDAERLAAEALEAERLEAERLEAERLEAERLEAERLEAERLEAERLEAERLEAERLAAEAVEAERLEAERLAIASVALAANALSPVVTDDPVSSVADEHAVFAPQVDEPTDVLQPNQVLPPPAQHTAPVTVQAARLPVVASSAPVNVTIDADAFARVFATVFASLIEHRLVDQPGQMYMRSMMEAPAPVQPKQGFWSHARHPDVFLMGIATIIVLVVLAAWLV